MNVGSREMFTQAEMQQYSARDYVQDGLIAIWDGIENDGWGKHDPDATSWADLISGMSFESAKNKGLMALDKSFVIPTGDYGYLADIKMTSTLKTAVTSNEFTFELVCSFPKIASDNIFIIGIDRYKSSSMTETKCLYISGSSYVASKVLVSGSLSLNIQYGTHSVVWAGTKIYKDSTYLGSFDRTPNGCHGISLGEVAWGKPSNSNIDYFSLRFYNRALAQSEIAINYAIDKARFNLTNV